jgi:hypothetical protein
MTCCVTCACAVNEVPCTSHQVAGTCERQPARKIVHEDEKRNFSWSANPDGEVGLPREPFVILCTGPGISRLMEGLNAFVRL